MTELAYITTQPKPSIWTRLSHFVLGIPPIAKSVPAHMFQPLPATHPDAVTIQVLTIGRALIEDRKDSGPTPVRDPWTVAAVPSAPFAGPRRLLSLHGPQTAANTMLLSVAMSRGFNDIESMNDN